MSSVIIVIKITILTMQEKQGKKHGHKGQPMLKKRYK